MSGNSATEIEHVSELINHPDPYSIPYAELQALRLKLLQKWFDQNYRQIPVLQRAADRKGITRIEKAEDAIPLLFSHSTYKTYPESFLEKGQWDKLNLWLATLTVHGDKLKQMNTEGISGLDDWLSAVEAQGFAMSVSSGTSGKPSFIPRRAEDGPLFFRSFITMPKLGQGFDEGVQIPILLGFFREGWHVLNLFANELLRQLPDWGVTFAFDGRLSPTTIRQEIKMRRMIAEGKLSPDEVAAFEKLAEEQKAIRGAVFQQFIQKVMVNKGKRIFLLAQTSVMYQMAANGLALGLENFFAPDSIIMHAGGAKGFKLPPDYQEQMARFFGVPLQNVVNFYAMSEKGSASLFCQYGRNHVAPWEIPLILDREGEKLLNPEFGSGEVIVGRYAFVDLVAQSHWGGVTTGDQVKVSFERCPCGREGPQILEIARYSDLPDAPDDDKLSCSTEMAYYVNVEMELGV
ncbi:MAG: hypothetical protein HXX08_17085 [Chloroflexi bacterium]|uniref:Phenylacetate--CoA ligase family protein n=1 Tax=Candidatus Chlorohelix allophototropha TaxID=3003348 RepID=A0A8T7M651_9CHLR|nr:hypothetical protein [Chloroflexota bacterium]WJW69484.1 hypothetical protein OZ401_003100 [Chloroflexota bacterium L227-S17]